MFIKERLYWAHALDKMPQMKERLINYVVKPQVIRRAYENVCACLRTAAYRAVHEFCNCTVRLAATELKQRVSKQGNLVRKTSLKRVFQASGTERANAHVSRCMESQFISLNTAYTRMENVTYESRQIFISSTFYSTCQL